MKRHTLYRIYDKFGELLYVGVTVNLQQRLAYHRSSLPSMRYAARITVQDAGTDRKAAEALEAEAIRTEEPLHNLAHSTLPRDLDALRTNGTPPREEWRCVVAGGHFGPIGECAIVAHEALADNDFARGFLREMAS